LRWSDIDLAHSAIGFSRALVEGPDGPVLQPTKNRRTYRVALDQETLATVIEHARRRSGRGTNAGVEPGDGFVFSDDPTGRRPWQPNWVTKRFIRYRQRAGLAHFGLHDLRHFMATTMLAAGVPVPVVSERLCHARTSTTVNIYATLCPAPTARPPTSSPTSSTFDECRLQLSGRGSLEKSACSPGRRSGRRPRRWIGRAGS
jgi:integrase